MTEAKEVIQHASTPPTGLTVTEPLPAKPKPGESVYYIGCGFPVCDQIFEGIKAGSETLGWKATKINIDQSNPATINSGVEQAIQNGATIVIRDRQRGCLVRGGPKDRQGEERALPRRQHQQSTG